MSPPSRVDSNVKSKDSARRLITRACDTCRRKKIRCEPISDSCVQCIKSKAPCHFTKISVPISRRRVLRDRHVEELEQRLARLEGQLKLQGKRQQPSSDLSALVSGSSSRSHDITDTKDQSTYMVPYAFDINFLGSAPIVTEDFASPIQNSNTTAPLQQLAISEIPGLNSRLENYATGKSAEIFQELPTKRKALQLLAVYFQGLNAVRPIFDQTSFMSKFDASYGVDCRETDPGWWAALNVVLALAHQSWNMPSSDAKDDLEGWGYFQNALAATNELITGHYTLTSVQALLGMAMIMMAMPVQMPYSLLISSAIKIAQHLGLHRQDQYLELSAAENLERGRVFWVAYALDRDVSLRTGLPPTQKEEDMDIDLPSDTTYDSREHGGVQHSPFYFRTKLAIVQGQIYRQLLSVKAAKYSHHERAREAEKLLSVLQGWKRSVPVELFCDYSGPLLDDSSSRSARHPVYLQLLYFETLAVIQESLLTLPWNLEIKSVDVRIHIMSASVTYPAEARSAIKLFNVTPRKKLACVWTALHIFITATKTLLMQTISEPSNPLMQEDLKLLQPFINLLGVAARRGTDKRVAEMSYASIDLFEKARTAVEHSDLGQNMAQPRGSNTDGRESLEDFLNRIEHISSGDSVGPGLTPPIGWQ